MPARINIAGGQRLEKYPSLGELGTVQLKVVRHYWQSKIIGGIAVGEAPGKIAEPEVLKHTVELG